MPCSQKMERCGLASRSLLNRDLATKGSLHWFCHARHPLEKMQFNHLCRYSQPYKKPWRKQLKHSQRQPPKFSGACQNPQQSQRPAQAISTSWSVLEPKKCLATSFLTVSWLTSQSNSPQIAPGMQERLQKALNISGISIKMECRGLWKRS